MGPIQIDAALNGLSAADRKARGSFGNAITLTGLRFGGTYRVTVRARGHMNWVDTITIGTGTEPIEVLLEP